jgi:hypothetical protein
MLSIKVRVVSGCFHREHSPHAYEIIDEKIRSMRHAGAELCHMDEHESGPELLVALLPMAKDIVELADSLIDLVTTILRARFEGIRRGDHPSEAIELIVRTSDRSSSEEVLLRFTSSESITPAKIKAVLEDGAAKILSDRRRHDAEDAQP